MGSTKTAMRSSAIVIVLGIICILSLTVSIISLLQMNLLTNQVAGLTAQNDLLKNQLVDLHNQVMGYIEFTTNKTGKAIQIQSLALSGTTFHVYVQNVGDSQISLVSASCLYINGTMHAATPSLTVLNQGETSDISLASAPVTAGDLVTIKVISSDGTFSQVTMTLPR